MQAHTARSLIELALNHERKTRSFARILAIRLAELYPDQHIHLTRTSQFLHFVFQYIRHTADVLESMNHAAECSGLNDQAQPLTRMFDDLFLLGSGSSEDKRSIEEILDESYVIHRLIEVINQMCLNQGYQPLLALEMSTPNLIIRTLIGPPYVEELEEIAHDAATALMHQTKSLRQRHEWQDAWQQNSRHLGDDPDVGQPFFAAKQAAIDWGNLQ